jgi:hypothetical protein
LAPDQIVYGIYTQKQLEAAYERVKGLKTLSISPDDYDLIESAIEYFTDGEIKHVRFRRDELVIQF